MDPIWLPVLGLSGLLGLAVLMYPASHRLNIPYTVLLAVTGCLLGYFAEWGIDLRHLEIAHDFLGSLNSFSVSSDAVLFIFLPVLIFEAALGIDAHRLMDDIASILLLAIIGLLISAFMVGYVLHWVSGISLIVCLLLGAIVSATDPVAVMAIFKDLQAPKRLSVLVEGESLFNDATAIVLFGILAAMLSGNSDANIISGIQSFLKVFVLGILVGMSMGYIFCSVLSRMGKYPLVQITLTLSLAYLSFILAEHYLHVSGVMAVVGASLVVGSFGHATLSPETWKKLHETWDHFAFWANSVIFILVGMIVPKILERISLHESILLGVLIVVAFGARALVLFGALPLFERVHATAKINNAYKAVMLWGGLRGAVSLALALSIMENELFSPEIHRFIGVLVTGFVLFTLLVNATTIGAVLKLFGLDQLGPADQIIRSRALKHSLTKSKNSLKKKALNHNIKPELSDDIIKQYQEDEEAVNNLLAESKELSGNDWVRVGLFDLCALEKAGYLKQFEEGFISTYIVRRLLAQVEDMLDSLQTGSAGYHKSSTNILEFNWRFHLALTLHRSFGYSRGLSTQLADRFEILLANQTVMKDNLLTALPQIEPLIGSKAGRTLKNLIEARLEKIEQALHMLQLQYPDYFLMLQKRYLSHVAIRLQEADFEQLRKETVISVEVYKNLEANLEIRMRKIQPRPTLDLQLEPEKLVRSVPLFSNFPPDRLDHISRLLKPMLVVPGEVILKKGEIGHSMYFISSGCVEVEIQPIPVCLGSGDFFGEIALIKKIPRTFSIKALGFCDLLVLSDIDFNLFLDGNPEIRKILSETADKRIEMDDQ
ncbi:MAG: cyclic nucleotide-binding domain-containing protein [Nitrospina sp.]|nr:cyclic nucleotide-binding domain-containing protein [Nitrospina sp.]MBT3922207.1 cyclic nucleotide-binding domain-containing protein [Nitrospina sp.]